MNLLPKPSRRWTRRAFLTSMIAPLGYVGYRVAAHNQWIIATRNSRAYDIGVEPTAEQAKQSLSILIVGDTGKDTIQRKRVVDAMQKHAAWSSPGAAFLLGDNFYENGVDSVEDDRFDSDFESLFTKRRFDFPFYACLGNHDVHGNAEAQVAYSQRSERWTMPARYFKTTQTAGDTTVECVFLDTNQLVQGSREGEEQIAWVRHALSTSDADYRIVIGHHPALTGGQHELPDQISSVLPPLFAEHHVDLYISGHDHDLQMLDSGDGWKQIVSGAGSKLRSTSWIDETMFAMATAGFCWLLADTDQLSVSFYSVSERLFSTVLPRTTNRIISDVASD
ncbi:metallophosphoesterase [Planctomycetes bacterium TBK1r]|uniref:Calcineurin-like phosphoesterase n=1 Tax=Stieleria magnilauensis TaxID=2527963 RepID=A0ABX5XVH6_9BACT|nr:Calcineurin-like phosphoesterase [Planctomycetes bacterium TBK1r]